jgi:hypothetical protein
LKNVLLSRFFYFSWCIDVGGGSRDELDDFDHQPQQQLHSPAAGQATGIEGVHTFRNSELDFLALNVEAGVVPLSSNN